MPFNSRKNYRLSSNYAKYALVIEKFDKPIKVTGLLIFAITALPVLLYPQFKELIVLGAAMVTVVLLAVFFFYPLIKAEKLDNKARLNSLNPQISILVDHFCVDHSEVNGRVRVSNMLKIRPRSSGVRSFYLSLQYHGPETDVEIIQPRNMKNFRLFRPTGEPGLDFEFLFDQPLELNKTYNLKFEAIFNNEFQIIGEYVGKIPPYHAEHELKLELRLALNSKAGFARHVFHAGKRRQPQETEFIESSDSYHVWSIPFPDHQVRYNLAYCDVPHHLTE